MSTFMASPITSTSIHSRHTLLQQVVACISTTNTQYASLFKPIVQTHPILYWSDPLTARFATFGVNPSATEFTPSRNWPTGLTTAQLDTRCANYFTNAVPPHPWFEGYDDPLGGKALNLLGHSYKHDSVHLDLSPRATKAMSTVNRVLFQQMVRADMQWFLAALAMCKNLKAAIMSGSVTNAFYFDEFLQKALPPSFSLKRLAFGGGRGATTLYELAGPGLAIPVLFCGTSPSGDKGVRLASEVSRLLPLLKTSGF